ncbi:MAG: hypothetical protein H7Y01_04710 [Ferruginibacter sp.]|nr:hypothetical protein [Chitinophagaceae bacterium]
MFVNWISSSASPGTKIANAHMIFNIGGVLLFAWFIPQIHKLMMKLVPDKRKTTPVLKPSYSNLS